MSSASRRRAWTGLKSCGRTPSTSSARWTSRCAPWSAAGDLADLKVKSLDVEAWSPRQQKYFEVGSCSNLGDAQARRLGIRVKNKETKQTYLPHTLNNTVVAPPRMLIAFLENNLNDDGSVRIPEPLRMYMGGKDVIRP